MIKMVLFDFDGTIGDTLPLVVNTIAKAVKPFVHKDLTYDEIAKTFGPCEEGSILKLVPNNFDEAATLFHKYYREEHHTCAKPFAGIKELIAKLKAQNILVGLVTGKSEFTTHCSLEQYQMDTSFDVIKTGSMQKSIKTQCIKEIIAKYKLNPQEVIYIGDMPSDIDSARAAQTKIVSVLYATPQSEQAVKAKQPDKICYSIQELAAYLLNEVKQEN